MMKGDLCRTARTQLKIGNIHKLTDDNKMLLDHLLNCMECQAWAKRSGFLPQLEEAVEQRMNGLHCPICLYPMKVNKTFKVAKCFKCNLEIHWSNPFSMAASILRIIEIQARRKGIHLDRLPISA